MLPAVDPLHLDFNYLFFYSVRMDMFSFHVTIKLKPLW